MMEAFKATFNLQVVYIPGLSFGEFFDAHGKITNQ